MGTYKEIRGTHIVSVTSDPPSPVNGQMWYNSTDKVIKGFTSNAAGAWASGGALGTGRERGAGNGTQTSALAYGGMTAPGAPNRTGKTESYNGTSFSEVNDLNTARYDISGGAGTDSTQALCIGGQTGSGRQVITESWNGSSWTEVGDLNISKGAGQGTGTYTSAIATGGDTTPTADAETWNGSSWTEVSDMNRSRVTAGMSGTSNTAALAFGGLDPSPAAIHGETESWNGSAWTELNDLNQARDSLSGSGTYTSAIAAGGDNPASTKLAVTESWNGTSWTEVADLSTTRSRPMNNAGLDATQALVSGGAPHITTTEELNLPATSTVTFTVS